MLYSSNVLLIIKGINIDKRTNGHVPDYVSRERSHSNDSRASAKNNQGKCDQPKSIKPQMPEQPRVFKSAARLTRSRNTSNNVNSANNKSKTENISKKTTQGRSASRRWSLSQSVDRMRIDWSKSKNRSDKNPDPNIDKSENQQGQT